MKSGTTVTKTKGVMARVNAKR